MKRALFAMLVSVVALACVSSAMAKGITVLYWEDSVRGSTPVPGGIALAGDTAVAATSEANFLSLLSGGGWGAVIYGIEGSPYSNGAGIQSALQSYISGGGHVIASTWLSYGSCCAAGPDILAMMGASNRIDIDNNTFFNDGSFAFAGVSGNADVSAGASSYGIYNQSYQPLAGSVGYSPLGDGSYGIIVGNGGRTILDGPLFPAFSNTATGQQIIANELNSFSTPEPGTLLTLGTGLLGVLGIARRKFSL